MLESHLKSIELAANHQIDYKIKRKERYYESLGRQTQRNIVRITCRECGYEKKGAWMKELQKCPKCKSKKLEYGNRR